MTRTFIAVVIACLGLSPVTVQAETVVRFAETVTVSDTQAIESDFYVLAGTAAMSGAVQGDMYVVGGTVTVNGPIDADFTAVSGRTQLSATVTDDVRLLTGEAVLSGPVGGDVFVLGGSLQVLSTASIAGDVYMFGGEADIAGPVAGSVLGTYTSLRIDSEVAGDVDVRTSSELTLGAAAAVGGDVRYVSRASLVRSPEATIAGSVLATEPTATMPENNIRALLIPFLILLFSTLVVYLIAKPGLHTVASRAVGRPGRAALLGLLLSIMLPITAVLLLVTSLGALLGIIVLALWLVGLVTAYVLAPIVVGAWLTKAFRQSGVTLVSVVLGAVAFYGLSIIPVVNVAVVCIVVCIGLGIAAEELYRRVRR